MALLSVGLRNLFSCVAKLMKHFVFLSLSALVWCENCKCVCWSLGLLYVFFVLLFFYSLFIQGRDPEIGIISLKHDSLYLLRQQWEDVSMLPINLSWRCLPSQLTCLHRYMSLYWCPDFTGISDQHCWKSDYHREETEGQEGSRRDENESTCDRSSLQFRHWIHPKFPEKMLCQ